jgi:GntR family transcriptional regulator/MocR family aminotransferase
VVSPGVDGPPAGSAADAPILSRRTIDLLATGLSPQAPFGDPAIAFPLGQPDRDAFPYRLWAKLLEQEWRKPAWQVAGAPHPFGHPGLREAIATYLGVARGFTCDARAIIVTSGLRQSIATLARMVLDAGDKAWIEDPGFRGTREGLAAADVRAVPVPIDASGFSVEAALELAPDARLAIVAPSHQFPLGTVLGLQRRLELLSWAERMQSWIVEDDFDGEYRYSGRPLAPLRALDRNGRVAYLGSFSKLLFPTLRLSFLALPPSLVEAAEQIMVGVSPRASLLGQGGTGPFHLGGAFRGPPATHAPPLRKPSAGADRVGRTPPCGPARDRPGSRRHARDRQTPCRHRLDLRRCRCRHRCRSSFGQRLRPSRRAMPGHTRKGASFWAMRERLKSRSSAPSRDCRLPFATSTSS